MATYSIADFGAVGDGVTNNAEHVQRAIDACHEAGGGRVLVPAGNIYACGTIELKDRVDLHLENGSILRASHHESDYAVGEWAGIYGGNVGGFLIHASGAEHLSISGRGVIDGQGAAFMDGWWTDDGEFIRKPRDFRPRILGFFGCNNVRVEMITIKDSPQWTCHFTGCEDVVVHGISIRNALDVPNCDGIDPDHCRNVRISDCHIEAGDDGIVIKATKEYAHFGPSENITVTGCTIVSTSSAIKIGTETASDVRDVVVTGCIIKRSHRGLSIQLRDSGNVENIIFSDCIVETQAFHKKYWGNGEAVYITAVRRHDDGALGVVRNVVCQNIVFRGENGVFLYSSDPGHIRKIFLSSIHGTIRKVSEFPVSFVDLRPRHSEEHGGLEQGKLSGITARHVIGLTIRDCSIQFEGEEIHHWEGPIDTQGVEDLVLEDFRPDGRHPTQVSD